MMWSTLHATRGLVVAVAVFASGVLASLPPAGAVAGHPPGVVGAPITLASGQLFQVLGHPYDVQADSVGTAYVGWVSSTQSHPARKVHLCTLPVGASSCSGGIQTIDSLAFAGAGDLHIVITGANLVHLLWFHDTASGGAVAEATAVDGANLSPPQDVVTTSSSVGSLLAAERGPGGSIWTVAYAGTGTHSVDVRGGISASPVTVTTPSNVAFAQLAFTGGTPVLAVEDGQISSAPRYATRSAGGTWSSFHAVAHTWSVGTNAALETTGHGLRLVTEVNNASYRPVIARWTGSGFAPRQLTADNNNCAPNTHDGWTDASGRLLDVSWECNDITITNYPDALHAAITRYHVAGTPTYRPQAASGVRGIATVVWTVQAGASNVLRVAHVRLPDALASVSDHATGGRVIVGGPRSCLPPVNVHVGWRHPAAANWSFRSGSLRLDNTTIAGSTLDGATLTPGKQYRLIGTATFARGPDRSTAQATLIFDTCGTG